MTKPIPEGNDHAITPYLIVKRAPRRSSSTSGLSLRSSTRGWSVRRQDLDPPTSTIGDSRDSWRTSIRVYKDLVRSILRPSMARR